MSDRIAQRRPIEILIGAFVGVFLASLIGISTGRIFEAATLGLLAGVVLGSQASTNRVYANAACAAIGAITVFLIGDGCDYRDLNAGILGAGIGLLVGQCSFYMRCVLFSLLIGLGSGIVSETSFFTDRHLYALLQDQLIQQTVFLVFLFGGLGVGFTLRPPSRRRLEISVGAFVGAFLGSLGGAYTGHLLQVVILGLIAGALLGSKASRSRAVANGAYVTIGVTAFFLLGSDFGYTGLTPAILGAVLGLLLGRCSFHIRWAVFSLLTGVVAVFIFETVVIRDRRFYMPLWNRQIEYAILLTVLAVGMTIALALRSVMPKNTKEREQEEDAAL